MRALDKTPLEERRFWANMVIAIAAVALIVQLYLLARGQVTAAPAAAILIAVLMGAWPRGLPTRRCKPG